MRLPSIPARSILHRRTCRDSDCIVRDKYMKTGSWANNRGIALLIVLLVTALLIALIFEFSYATRISLNSAVNFRDSQRAYFLTRSGIKALIKYKDTLNIPHNEWAVVPFINGEDSRVLVKLEDETGKIGFTDVKGNTVTQAVLQALFENKQIDISVYNRMIDPTSNIFHTSLLSELHQYMSDEDYIKIANDLTVSIWHNININTASRDVLQSLGISSGAIDLIIQNRQNAPYKEVPNDIIGAIMINKLNVTTLLTTNSNNIYTVHCNATVGGYTKVTVAIVGSNPPYWRAL